MYVLNAIVTILAILTKVVISLAFSKISPEAGAKSKNYQIWYKNQWKMGKFCG